MRFIDYDRGLAARARKLRSAMTRGEVILWTRLRRKQLGVGFRRQRPVGNYIADFYCPKLRLVIEVHGASHDEKSESDAVRDGYFRSNGITVLRFSDFKVCFDEDTVIDQIERVIERLAG